MHYLRPNRSVLRQLLSHRSGLRLLVSRVVCSGSQSGDPGSCGSKLEELGGWLWQYWCLPGPTVWKELWSAGVERAVVCRDILRLPSLYSQVSRHDGTECQRRDGGGGQQEKENKMSNENSIHICGM